MTEEKITLPAEDQSNLTDQLLAFAGAIGMAIAEGMAIYRYISSRTEVKQANLRAKEQMYLACRK